MLVAGHRFQASGNEKKDIALDCVAGYRFCRNGLSKIGCTVEQIEEVRTKVGVNKAKGPDSIGKILLKKLAPTLCKSRYFSSLRHVWQRESSPKSVIAPLNKKIDTIMFYLPINCLCCDSKVLEKVIFDCLYNAIPDFSLNRNSVSDNSNLALLKCSASSLKFTEPMTPIARGTKFILRRLWESIRQSSTRHRNNKV